MSSEREVRFSVLGLPLEVNPTEWHVVRDAFRIENAVAVVADIELQGLVDADALTFVERVLAPLLAGDVLEVQT